MGKTCSMGPRMLAGGGRRDRRLETEIAECEARVGDFEGRHGMPLACFEREVLAKRDDFQVHEEYADWSYWQKRLEEKRRALADLEACDED